jgi:hypothetical protein
LKSQKTRGKISKSIIERIEKLLGKKIEMAI